MFKRFIISRKVKNLSPATILFYDKQCSVFLDAYGDIDVLSIDKSIIDEYQISLLGKKISDVTVRTYMRALKVFIRYAFGELGEKPPLISLPKATKKPKVTYSMDELEKMLRKPNLRSCDTLEYKCWALCNYLLGTGNRISTALNLKVEDIDFSSCCILLKKNKDREVHIIPLSCELSGVLQEYILILNLKPSDYLFCSKVGTVWERHNCYSDIAKYNHSRGVDRHGLHLFRHTFAKMWILNGGDIFRLQKILGHKDITMVKEYVQMFGSDLRKDFDTFNPLGCFKKKSLSHKLNTKKA